MVLTVLLTYMKILSDLELKTHIILVEIDRKNREVDIND